MSHDARVLLGREVTVKKDIKKNKYRIAATSDSTGTIYAYLMNKKGDMRRETLGTLKFLKVYDYETKELVDAKKQGQ